MHPRSHWLFSQHSDAALQCGDNELVVRVVNRAHDERVEVFIIEHLDEIFRAILCSSGLAGLGEDLLIDCATTRVEIAQSDDIGCGSFNHSVEVELRQSSSRGPLTRPRCPVPTIPTRPPALVVDIVYSVLYSERSETDPPIIYSWTQVGHD